MPETLLKFREKNFQIQHKLDVIPPNTNIVHAHDDIEIFYFISGDCYYLVEGSKYRLRTGDIMIMRPLEAHHLVVCSDKVPYERIVANINPVMLKGLDPSQQILSHLFNRPLGTLNRFDSAVFAHSLCSECFAMIATHGHDMGRLDLISRVMFVLTEADRAIKRLNPELRKDNIGDLLINYVNQNLFRNISLQQLSDVFFLSQSQINRIFKKNTGSSIGQYVAKKRLLTARNRIRAGEPAVKVSEECGYRDYSAFYRSYCTKFGCTPQADKNSN